MGSTIIEQDFPYDILHRGKRDEHRHNKRVQEATRKQLKDIISQQDIITSEGNRKVKVRLKYLDQYRFIHSRDRVDEVGRDQFDELLEGELLSKPQSGNGASPKPGNSGGEELYEAEYTIDELTEMMIKELELPDLDDTKKNKIVQEIIEWDDRRPHGIRSLIDKRHTILTNIKRQAKLGKNETIPIIDDDLRFKTWSVREEKHSNAVVFLMMDRSGCHAKDSWVETNLGWKHIQCLRIGDCVASLDISTGEKQYCGIKKIFHYPNQKTYFIKTEDTTLQSTYNHSYFVLTEDGITQKTVAELRPGDKLIYNMRPLSKPCLDITKGTSSDKYYLSGFALGDGNIHDTRFSMQGISRQQCYRQGSAYLQITDCNHARLEKLLRVANNSFGKTARIINGDRQRLRINSCDVVDFVSELNPYTRLRSPKRRFSENVMNLPIDHLSAYISGLFDAEGSVSDHSAQMTVSSFNLVQDLKIALSRFGIRAKLSPKQQSTRLVNGNRIKGGEYYHIQINAKDCITFHKLIGFSCEDKQSKLARLVDKQLNMLNAMRSKYITIS